MEMISFVTFILLLEAILIFIKEEISTKGKLLFYFEEALPLNIPETPGIEKADRCRNEKDGEPGVRTVSVLVQSKIRKLRSDAHSEHCWS